MFGGGGSIQLARVFGIRVGVEPSWFLILFVVIWFQTNDYATEFPGSDIKAFALGVLTALLFFGSIVLHELGHAVAAMRSGIRIAGIDLWLFGGVAKLSRDSESAGEEFRVAAAGPLVTLLLAVAGCGVLLASGEGLGAIAFDPSGDRTEFVAVVGALTWINMALLVFNLVPAFPLDGGRIARAAAWRVTGDRSRATRFAARLGRLFGWAMVGFGVFLALATPALFAGIWLAVIGLMIGQAANASIQQTDVTDRIDGVRVADVMDDEPVAVPQDLTLDRAQDEYFLRYGWPWFPVVDAEGRFVGLVTQASVEGLPEAVRPGRTVASVMAADDAAESTMRVEADAPLETLLGLDGLARLGAVMAVDAEGRLRGLVTADQVRRALAPSS